MAKTIFPNLNNQKPVEPPFWLAPAEWRCLECGKLLGIRRAGKLQVRQHGHDYLVSLPVEATCRGCGAFNRT